MSHRSLISIALLLFSSLSFASERPTTLPNVYEVHFSLAGTNGKAQSHTAVVVEGAKASLQLREGMIDKDQSSLRIQFSVTSDEVTSSKIGREAGHVDLSLSKNENGHWVELGKPSFVAVLGSKHPANLYMADKDKKFEITVGISRGDATKYADRIAALASKPPVDCDKAQLPSTSLGIATPSVVTAPNNCCCTVGCDDGRVWTCCNVLSCSCGSNTCSPSGGYLCY